MRNGYPLAELHRHLEGSVRPETVLDLAQQHGVELPAYTVEDLRPFIQVADTTPDLMAFIAKFEFVRRSFVNYQAIRRITCELLDDAALEGIDYLELRFSPYYMAEPHGLNPIQIVETVCQAVHDYSLDVALLTKLICVLSRTYGPETTRIELEAAIAHADTGIVAIDLAGDERKFPGHLFVSHYEQAKEAGLRLVAHAGEAAGADSVRQAIVELSVDRIGHCVAAKDDESVMDLIGETGTAIECCPTSNLQTSTVENYADHPMPTFLRRGLLVTLNTDDPCVSDINLAYEYEIAEQEMGLSTEELMQVQRNALDAAFLTESERASLIEKCAG